MRIGKSANMAHTGRQQPPKSRRLRCGDDQHLRFDPPEANATFATRLYSNLKYSILTIEKIHDKTIYFLKQTKKSRRNAMANFNIKGILNGMKVPNTQIQPKKIGMTSDIQCITCGKLLKRWSALSANTTVCEECLAQPRTSH
jgi:hypothetical protein